MGVYISCDVGVNLCSEAASQGGEGFPISFLLFALSLGGYQKASAVLVTSLVSAVIGGNLGKLAVFF